MTNAARMPPRPAGSSVHPQATNLRTLLFGTIDGVIGVLASLPQPLFETLSRLQVSCVKTA